MLPSCFDLTGYYILITIDLVNRVNIKQLLPKVCAWGGGQGWEINIGIQEAVWGTPRVSELMGMPWHAFSGKNVLSKSVIVIFTTKKCIILIFLWNNTIISLQTMGWEEEVSWKK